MEMNKRPRRLRTGAGLRKMVRGAAAAGILVLRDPEKHNASHACFLKLLQSIGHQRKTRKRGFSNMEMNKRPRRLRTGAVTE